MRKRFIALLVGAITVLALALPAAASADYQYGSTATWPWSGYWWPMLSSDTNLYDNGQALQKYDQYLQNTTGTAGNAQSYEQQHYSTSDSNNSWWGHCHAWAAASILTKEPPHDFTKGGVFWNTNDTKGLITDLYYSPKLSWLSGTREDDPNDTTSAAFKDIAPAWMDYLLQYYVRYYKYPFIMDINANAEVWNFPVFAYTRNATTNADGSQDVTTQVWYSSPDYNAIGTHYFSRTYTYTLQSGTLGTWTGNSVMNHPDFAWLPTGRNPVPHLDPNVVSQIVGETV
jgi:hypothetical protein